jgi:hypothetical protein
MTEEADRAERFVAVTTVLDRGAAEVFAEALQAAEIPVELRRVGNLPYHGAATESQYEVRVPEDRLPAAEGVLRLLSEEGEAAAIRESADAATPEGAAAPAPPAREWPLHYRLVACLFLLLMLAGLVARFW